MITRRAWLQAAVLTAGGSTLMTANAQQQSGIVDTSNLFAMDQAAARSVRLPPKPGATASMTPADRDALEHRIRCQCGCTLDVFTCRTTDFSCQVSPAMHRDVLALVQGGYTAQEILDAFVTVYGERALMAPPARGVTRVAYLVPGAVMAIGAVALSVALRRWRRAAVVLSPAGPAAEASDDELRRIHAALREPS